MNKQSDKLITGIHHVTALTSNPQKNIDFYAGILGLRLVKKTVNFDAPDVYHFYFGDETGKPGSIITFFPYKGLVQGRHGKGMLNTTSFSVPVKSMDFWFARLKRFGIEVKNLGERFQNEVVAHFTDFDGLGLELVFNDSDSRQGMVGGSVSPEHSIRGFYSVEIWEEGYERTAGLLTEQLDHHLVSEQGDRFRFGTDYKDGGFIDLVCKPDSLRGLGGSGTVHHLAFSTPSDESQGLVRERIVKRMFDVTPPLNRQYFNSIYFREPGGVLFEVATATPGFLTDEPKETLGQALKLPPWFEKHRDEIENSLDLIKVDLEKYK